MTSLQRYKDILAGQPTDIIPRIPIVMQFAAEYIGSNYGEFASDYQTLVKANVQCAQDFSFDQLSVISDPYRETQGFGAQIEFIKDGVPKCLKPPLEDSKNISTLLKPDPHKSTRMLDRVNAIESYHSQFNGQYSIMGWVEGPAAEAADLRGVGNFLMDLIDDQEFSQELMDFCVQVAIDFAYAQIKAGADTIGIGDAIASQLSPKLYEQLIFPREKLIVQAIQQTGAFARLHICGNITHLLPAISELKVDILDIDHMIDIELIRKTTGEKVVLAGNINPVNGVKNGSPQSIRKKIVDIYNKVGNRYMVNAGCEIPVGTPYENLLALCEPIEYK